MTRPHRVLALFVAAAWFAVAAPAPAQTTPGLVPANWSQVTDSQGFVWDLQSGGYLNQGTNYCFSNAMTLQINNNGFGGSTHLMTPDGSEYILQQNLSGIDVTRRVKVDARNAVCRWVDSFTNSTPSAQSITVAYHTGFNNRAQVVVSDRGRVNATSLEKNEGGLLVVSPPNQGRPGAFFALATANSKVKPTIQIQNNSRFIFTYTLRIDPGKTLSLCTYVGQRWTHNPPTTEKETAAIFRPVYGRRMLSDLPRPILPTIVNWRGGGGFDPGERPMLWTLPADLGIEPGSDDVLAVGEGTRLKGTASCDKLIVTTRYGVKECDFAHVAALAGPRFVGRDTQVYLRDGQLLTGQVQATNLRFQLASGPRIDLDFAMLDRLVMRQTGTLAAAEAPLAAVLETFDGDRLALPAEAKLDLSLVTPWGGRAVSLADLRWVRNVTDERAGYEAALTDGSRFFCFLDGTTFSVNTLLFGPQQFHTSQIRMLTADLVAPTNQRDKEDDRLHHPHVLLAGGQVLAGRVEQESIPLLTLAGVIPLPPGQIRQMRNVTDESPMVPGDTGVVFHAEMWGGGAVVGRYQPAALPVRCGSVVWQVPARDVAEVIVPTPVVPEATHARALLLIRDLGHPDWSRREEAQRELLSLGSLAAAPLREAATQSQDAEIRRRAAAIVEQLD